MTCDTFLKSQIEAEGPMPIDRFIQHSLSHPEFGYYALKDRFGRDGDFVTAPEISQLFGEMMAGFLSYLWHASGQPAARDIIRFEAGPGRGTLFTDMHKTYQKICPPLSQAEPHFLEASPFLRDRVGQAISPLSPVFVETIADLPAKPLFGIANEFFDALGVRQAVYRKTGWVWRTIVVQDGAFTITDGPPLGAEERKNICLHPDPAEGDICETSPSSMKMMHALGNHIAKFGGGILICDYGKSDGNGDSLQAVKAHKKTDILAEPGECDITHLVDFSALRRQAKRAGARLVGPVGQGAFLTEMGIAERAEALRRQGQPETDRMLLAALDRLCSPQHMGQIFKVALLVPSGTGLPPGFSEAAT